MDPHSGSKNERTSVRKMAEKLFKLSSSKCEHLHDSADVIFSRTSSSQISISLPDPLLSGLPSFCDSSL
jgi:hypothetical protein